MIVKDVGKFLAVCFYIVAFIQIVFIFIIHYFTGDLNIQLSFLVNILIGYYLYEHNNKTRKIVMFFSGIIIILQIVVFLYLSIIGIPEGTHIRLLGFDISTIVSMKHVPMLFFISIIIPCIPFFLLRTKKAIMEFVDDAEQTIKS